MTDLFEKSMETLELPRVLSLLADQAVTEEGKERARRLRPETDPAEVALRLKETTAAVNKMVLRGSPSFSGVKPVAGSLQRADMGGSLNTRELLDIAGVLAAARSAKEYGESDGEEKSPIDVLFHSLHPNRFLEDKITGSIVGDGELADSASPELASIRRHIRATESKVRDILQKIISSSQAKYLQESIITQRSGRYVVPVKSEFKNEIPGLVHDLSGSGSTFFTEPMIFRYTEFAVNFRIIIRYKRLEIIIIKACVQFACRIIKAFHIRKTEKFRISFEIFTVYQIFPREFLYIFRC